MWVKPDKKKKTYSDKLPLSHPTWRKHAGSEESSCYHQTEANHMKINIYYVLARMYSLSHLESMLLKHCKQLKGRNVTIITVITRNILVNLYATTHKQEQMCKKQSSVQRQASANFYEAVVRCESRKSTECSKLEAVKHLQFQGIDGMVSCPGGKSSI